MQARNPSLVEVAVPLPIHRTFHYAVPERLAGPDSRVGIGCRVLVPFGRRRITGYVVGFPSAPGVSQLKEIETVLDREPVFDNAMLTFLKWAADYYLHPIGEVLKASLPEGMEVKTRRVVVLTDEGRAGLAVEALPLLRKIPAAGRLSYKYAAKLVGKAALARLTRGGLVAVESELVPERAGPRVDSFYRCSPIVRQTDIRRAPRQAELLAFIHAEGLVSMERLNEENKRAPVLIKELIGKGLVEKVETPWLRPPVLQGPRPEGLARERSKPEVLSAEQRGAIEAIVAAVSSGVFKPILLHGVTGSGKTEVYLAAIEAALEQGKGAIYLLPEISLSSHLYSLVRSRLGEEVALLHSGLSTGERFGMWRALKEGGARVAVGARSAVFAPLSNIGLIVVDEEHDGSYKQDEGFRYQARDMALMRGKLSGCAVVLGSATPAVESYHHAREKRYELLRLFKRVEDRPLPAVRLVDMKRVHKEVKGRAVLSPELLEALNSHLSASGQAILFLNRRGEETFLLCPECGFTYRCPNCSVALVSHGRGMVFRCHYCDYSQGPPAFCPDCRGPKIATFGIGTEKLESQVRNAFSHARVARVDSDVARVKGAVPRILYDFEIGRLDILVGTQMVAKGHDFPGVTLVGVVLADGSLNLPDFRAAEKTFQLLTQVAGRAGRGERPGEVIVQTYNPDHFSLSWAAMQDYQGFYEEEVALRKEIGYPPFLRLACVEVRGPDEAACEAFAKRLRRVAEAVGVPQGVKLLGPAPAPLYKLRGRYRWQVLIKGKSVSSLHRFIREMLSRAGLLTRHDQLALSVDVDPYSML